MKRTTENHWLKITLITLAACAVIGLVLSVILFNQSPGRTYAFATIQFSFDGAGEGKAPNGYPFDVNGIYSDEVLTNALEASELQDKYTTEEISNNLTITGIYPENIVKQMTAYNSPLDANTDQQAAMADYHATLYNVALYNDFDTTISSEALRTLLANILNSYRDYFVKTSAFSLQKTDPITDLEEYDYTQQLLAISEAADQQSRFAQEMADQAPDFRTGRKSFDDIVISYDNLKSDIDRLDADITLNTLSKDRERLQKQYEMELRTLNRNLESTQEELKRIEELVTSYEKDGIVYVSTSGSLQKVSSNASGTYDKLVEKRKELTDDISTINADISKYQALLDDMTRNSETVKDETAKTEVTVEKATETTVAADTATEATSTTETTEEIVDTSVELTEAELKQLGRTTEKQIETINAKKDKVTSDFRAMLDTYARQEINERTVLASSPRYTAPSFFSSAFIVKAIKTAGPICVLGFMVCLVLLIISRRKEEKGQKADE